MFSEGETQENHKIHAFIPPIRIKEKMYVCGKSFITEPIEKLYPIKDEVECGLCVVYGESFSIYKFTKSSCNFISKFDVDLPNAHSRGGQSQNRHQRNHDIIVNVYLEKVVEMIKNTLLDNRGLPNIEGIIIIGTGEKRFKVESKLPMILKELVYCNETINTISPNIEELVASKYSLYIDRIKSKKYNDVFAEFTKYFYSNQIEDNNRAIYGTKEVTKAIKDCQLQKLIIVKSKNFKKVQELCEKGGCTIYEIPDNFSVSQKLLGQFGGVVGISWF